MGRTVSIPQAVNYETRLVKHGLQHHNRQEVFDGLEHLANLSAQKGDGTEAGRITHLFIEELEGDPHASHSSIDVDRSVCVGRLRESRSRRQGW